MRFGRSILLTAAALAGIAPGLLAQEKGFLGIHVVPLPPEVRAQVDLPPEAGLMIDFILADSPAEKAGLQQFDILTKFGDQVLVNDEQVHTLVRNAPAGGTLDVHGLRKGKPATFQVTLSAVPKGMDGPAPKMPANSAPGPSSAPGASQSLAQLLNKHPDILSHLQNSGLLPGKSPAGQPSLGGSSPPASASAPIPVPAPAPSLASGQAGKPAPFATTWSMNLIDAEGSVTLREENGRKLAKVTGKDGQTLFEGPLQTPADRAALKPNILRRIEALEKSSPITSGEQPTPGK